MASDVKKILDEKDKEKKKALVEEFKTKHAENIDKLIDPNHPDLGPKNNQIVLAWGRLKGGRGEVYKRLADALGTVNAHGHTTVCQGSLYFTCKAISEQYIEGKFTDGKKFYWQADTENSKFIFFVGANLFEANYGPPNRSVRLTGNLVTGRTKIAVADPRFSKLALTLSPFCSICCLLISNFSLSPSNRKLIAEPCWIPPLPSEIIRVEFPFSLLTICGIVPLLFGAM